MRFWLIFIIITFFDQATKILVQDLMNVGDSVSVIGNLLSFTYILNPGAAFGYFPYQTTLFIAVTVLVICFIVFVNYQLPSFYSLMQIGLAFQLGGAMGNLIDRIRIGYVIDFINLSFFPPVFNIADAAIVIGVLYFALSIVFEGRQPDKAKKVLPNHYKKNILRFSPFGYDYKEVEDYLMTIAGDMELLKIGRTKIEEQIGALRRALIEVREGQFRKKEILQKAISNLEEIKIKTEREISAVINKETVKISKVKEKNKAAVEKTAELVEEKKLLELNKKKCTSALRITENALSAVYNLARSLPGDAAIDAEKTVREAEIIRQEALREKEEAEKEYFQALEENRRLQAAINMKREELRNNAEKEESLLKALAVSESLGESLKSEAQSEAEKILQEAAGRASDIIQKAQENAGKLLTKGQADNIKMQSEREKDKEELKKVLEKKLQELEEDDFIKNF